MKSIALHFAICSLIRLSAQDLCGPADQVVCLQNSTVVGVSCRAFGPGTFVYVSVPGMQVSDLNNISGPATVPYWLALHGFLNDSSGGSWSTAQELYGDARGARVIGFELLSGYLNDQVWIGLNLVQVCQWVSDGPGQVLLEVGVLGVPYAKAGPPEELRATVRKAFAGDGFVACSTYVQHPPLTESQDRLYLLNPHPSPMSLSIDGQPSQVPPAGLLELSGGELLEMGCSLPPALLAKVQAADLDLVLLHPSERSTWFFPHLAQDATLWRNRVTVALPESMTLSLLSGPSEREASFAAGLQAWTVGFSPQKARYAKLSSHAAFSALLQISRSDGTGGSAALEGVPTELLGAKSLVLPHIPSDTTNFWCGVSLANAGSVEATLEWTAYAEHGGVLARETHALAAESSLLLLVGSDLFAGLQPAWILLSSSRNLVGIELFGGRQAGASLAGLSLPDHASSLLAFPLVDAAPGSWTGLALLNPSGQSRSGVLSYYDPSGQELTRRTITLGAGVKSSFLVEGTPSHAIYRGDPMIGLCLMGDEGRSKLGGYMAWAE